MPPKRKDKLMEAEVLDRRAQAAYEYRYRHRKAVNEKARLRMRRSVNSGLLQRVL
ncbi:hypothetical protein C8F04DRAFT_1274527 [Mycena alexandri]|uniref:Uncharacterized protein n=1 Tax=Mycena alexandri TaxID=1745969 RepID=A0AAD6S3Z4_9AGAR|nr:hypothetical protein C8F04DRAFT_1274527 [Mycena alexandri]